MSPFMSFGSSGLKLRRVSIRIASARFFVSLNRKSGRNPFGLSFSARIGIVQHGVILSAFSRRCPAIIKYPPSCVAVTPTLYRDPTKISFLKLKRPRIRANSVCPRISLSCLNDGRSGSLEKVFTFALPKYPALQENGPAAVFYFCNRSFFQ